MKIEINVTAKEFEMANFLLGQAYVNAKESHKFKTHYGISDKQLVLAEKFRKKMVKQFLKEIKQR